LGAAFLVAVLRVVEDPLGFGFPVVAVDDVPEEVPDDGSGSDSSSGRATRKTVRTAASNARGARKRAGLRDGIAS
jgi:hypothetical protein